MRSRTYLSLLTDVATYESLGSEMTMPKIPRQNSGMTNNPYKCHYDVLGVSKNATKEEIKAAFRKLSLQTHPDLAGVGTSPERFKSVAQAANILSDPKLRQVYDQSLADRASLNNFRKSPLHGYNAASSSFGQQQPRGFTAILVNLFRPRNLIVGPIVFFAAVSGIQYAMGIDKNKSKRDESNLVQVWKNPETGQYETPAPWDPVYQKLQPELEYVPKDQVRLRKQ